MGDVGPSWGVWTPESHPGLGGVEEGRKGYCCPGQAAPGVGSSQLTFIRGVRAVGELNGGVTGALMEPPEM